MPETCNGKFQSRVKVGTEDAAKSDFAGAAEGRPPRFELAEYNIGEGQGIWSTVRGQGHRRQSVSAWWQAVKRPGSPTERKAGRVVTHSWVAKGHRV